MASTKGFALQFSINSILLFFAVVSVAALVASIALDVTHLGKAQSFIQSMEEQNSSVQAAVGVDPWVSIPVREVSAELSNRNIFQPAQNQPQQRMAEDPVSAASKNYRLAGIAPAANPRDTVVMVENIQTKSTLLLQLGKNVEGLQLEKVMTDSVVVKIGGISVELE